MDYNASMESVTWFRDRYQEGTLSLRPPYQRKPVWVARQKCYLIESLLLRLPIPEIYIQQTVTVEGKATYAVVDGQQRIRTVLQFLGADTDPDQQDYYKFALDKLSATSAWKNATFESLGENDRKEFYKYKFAIRYLNTESDDAVRDMFQRLNLFLSPLKPQENRNAMYSGPFVTLANKLADNPYWAENRIVSAASIRRMADIEFVSELIIGVLHGPQSGSAKGIDAYYAEYEDFDDEFPEQKTAAKLFDQSLTTVQRVLPEIKGTRWDNKNDFYTLFVAIASLLRSKSLVAGRISSLRKDLMKFAEQVDARLADESVQASRDVIKYVRAIEKGVNDKKRRADRQEVLLKVLAQYFK